MKLSELAQLTDEEKRVALAKFCGWKRLGKWEGFFKWENPAEDIKYGQKYDEFSCIPDYLNSRDAIAEVEAKLSGSQHFRFREVLHRLASKLKIDAENEWCDGGNPVERAYLSATARQRADAILMIL